MDLTKILKDCPIGTKFYSSYLGKNVIFIEIYDNHIKCEYSSQIDFLNCSIQFRKDGSLYPGGDCMLFPSKDQRDWSKWQRPFVDGDIVTFRDQLLIFKKYIAADFAECYVFLDSEGELDLDGGNYYVKKIATEEEKQKLFDAIKESGYEWNADTKELKKIELKFDVCTMCPSDKVLCRTNNDDIWEISLFERYIPTNPHPFFCIQDEYNQCVPYNDDTKHLVGTCNKAPEKYINW